MKFTRLEYAAPQICAAIIALAGVASAEEDPDEMPPQATVGAQPSGSGDEPAPLASVLETGAPEPGGSEPSGPPKGPPGGPGAPPLGGPPPMAVGELRIGVLTRADLSVNGDKFDDPSSTTLAGVGVLAQVHRNFKIATALMGSYDARDASGVATLLDAIVQFEPMPAFNVWLGRMVEPVDRSTLSGPWFMSPWYLTGLGYVDRQIPLPRTGFLGRSNGATVWGTFFAGHLKYYAAALDLVAPGESPMLAGRINLALLNPEPGYYNSSGYFGKDLLAIGAGAQSKKGGSVNPMTQEKSDYSEFNADLLFEKDLGSAGVFDLEGAYYKFRGDSERTSWSWLGLASYVVPGQFAGARLQPLVRMQQATPTAPGAPTSTLIDGQVSFLLNGYFGRLALGYRKAYAGSLESSSVFLGLQFMQL